jgi:histidinol-phosphatase (PHP family)
VKKSLSDCHVHSDQSRDATDSVMALCEKAIEIGFTEITLTDHYEPRPYGNDNPGYNPMHAWLEVRRARLRYGRELNVRLGVELGQPHMYPKESAGIIASVPYDYVLASVHTTIDGKAYYEMDYAGKDMRALREAYLAEVLSMVRWGHFDCVGHFDLPVRYAGGEQFDITKSADLTRTILKEMAQHGKALEVNTKGWVDASGKAHFVPGMQVVRWFRELGGEMIVLGSDAHHKENLGQGIGKAWDMLKEAGCTHTVSFKNRVPVWISLDDGSRRMEEVGIVV